MNEARASFFRTCHRTCRQPERWQSAAFLSRFSVTGAGSLGIMSPMLYSRVSEYVPQVYFNNFSIGAPSLITFNLTAPVAPTPCRMGFRR